MMLYYKARLSNEQIQFLFKQLFLVIESLWNLRVHVLRRKTKIH